MIIKKGNTHGTNVIDKIYVLTDVAHTNYVTLLVNLQICFNSIFLNMKITLLSISLSLFSIIVYGQSSKLIGSWLLTKVEVSGNTYEPYYITDFRSDGNMIVMDMEAGTWKLDGKKIIMKSDMDKDFNGVSSIVELTPTELIVTKEEAKLYYKRLNSDKIKEENAASGIIGIWNITNNEGATQLLKFESPDTYTYIYSTQGMSEKSSGTWIYNSAENTLIIIGMTHNIKGENKIRKITEDELVFETSETIISATKEVANNSSNERLNFTYEDIPEEPTGDYNLPWYDYYALVEYLQHVNYLKYRNGSLIKEMNTLKFTAIISEIEVDAEEQSVTFRNLWVSNNDTTQYSENYKGGMMESGNLFFPKNEPWPYKIVGIETVTVPAGTFECTVIIAFDGETRLKYWMINNKPGVYAKTITESISVFDELEYSVVELEEIK